MKVLKSYSSEEARSICGFNTIYMLHYLARQGVVVPSVEFEERRGKRYQYSFRDLVLLKAVQQLLAHGVSVKRLRAAQAEYRKLCDETGPDDLLERFLLTDGANVLFVEAPDRMIDLKQGPQLTMHLLLDLKPINDEVSERAKELTDHAFANSSSNRETINIATK
ncbi:MAG: MerR family transcriptional regulator [Rhodospirillaceae bacterium]|nr:MerR family transcriptional regulator [Rhodospirillaceae bacterium]